MAARCRGGGVGSQHSRSSLRVAGAHWSYLGRRARFAAGWVPGVLRCALMLAVKCSAGTLGLMRSSPDLSSDEESGMSLPSRPNSRLADVQRRFRAKRCEPVMSAKIWPKTAAALRRHGRDLIVEISDLQTLPSGVGKQRAKGRCVVGVHGKRAISSDAGHVLAERLDRMQDRWTCTFHYRIGSAALQLHARRLIHVTRSPNHVENILYRRPETLIPLSLSLVSPPSGHRGTP